MLYIGQCLILLYLVLCAMAYPISAGELDPQVANVIQRVERGEITVTDATMGSLSHPKEELANVINQSIPGPAGSLRIRIYIPGQESQYPVLVYFHGGGYYLGDLNSHDSICRSFTNRARCIVVAVAYRLSSSAKFPAAVEDGYAALKWVQENAGSFGGDAARVAVGGDSSGGNLAVVVCLMARDNNTPLPVYQILLYPKTDYSSMNTESIKNYGQGYLLTTQTMNFFQTSYFQDDSNRLNPYASPLLDDDFSGLPDAFVLTAEYDPLRDEGQAYAGRLKEASVDTNLVRYDGMIHGFINMGKVVDRALAAIQEAADALHWAFYPASKIDAGMWERLRQ